MADPPVTTEVHGVTELKRGSKTLFARIDDHVDKEFLSTADQVASMIRARQPRLTGRLAASAGAFGSDHGASVGIGGSGVPYAGWIEFGGTHGRPYVAEGRTVYPTAEESKEMFKRAGDTVARKQIGSMTWPKPSRL